MTVIKRDRSGSVYITDDVLSAIAGTAALEAEGVMGIFGQTPETSKRGIRKAMSKCIDVTVKGNDVAVTLIIKARMGSKINEVCAVVQRKVKDAIETMTGLNAAEVNVTVGSITSEA